MSNGEIWVSQGEINYVELEALLQIVLLQISVVPEGITYVMASGSTYSSLLIMSFATIGIRNRM